MSLRFYESFVVDVAHRINTPLGTAITGITLMEEQLEELKSHCMNSEVDLSGLRKKLERCQRVIESVSRNSARVVQQMDKIEGLFISNRADRIRTIPLNDVLERVCLSIKTDDKYFGLRLKVSCSDDLIISTYQQTLEAVMKMLIEDKFVGSPFSFNKVCFDARLGDVGEILVSTVFVREQWTSSEGDTIWDVGSGSTAKNDFNFRSLAACSVLELKLNGTIKEIFTSRYAEGITLSLPCHIGVCS
ncbi:MAG: hypothetical protein ACNI27_14350 [Desulfovibrio sp.]